MGAGVATVVGLRRLPDLSFSHLHDILFERTGPPAPDTLLQPRANVEPVHISARNTTPGARQGERWHSN